MGKGQGKNSTIAFKKNQLSAAMMIVGGAFHSGFVNTGLILRAKNSIHETDLTVMQTLFFNFEYFLLDI